MKKNKYDVYNWIIKVIDSCENGIQLATAYKLSKNFFDRYGDYSLLIKLLTNITVLKANNKTADVYFPLDINSYLRD